LRHDGSLLSAEGYDLATGLVLRSEVPMPPLSEFPTRSDAETAVWLLVEPLSEFPFVDDTSKAVALSMIMTPVLRGAMPAAPMHLATAPEAGTGKSYLADTASVIATGERIATVAVAPSPEETEKRLVGAALAGHPLIGLDNCRETLEGDFLCQITERPLLQLRALGKSD
jgi:putative DNA primase/helicase